MYLEQFIIIIIILRLFDKNYHQNKIVIDYKIRVAITATRVEEEVREGVRRSAANLWKIENFGVNYNTTNHFKHWPMTETQKHIDRKQLSTDLFGQLASTLRRRKGERIECTLEKAGELIKRKHKTIRI